MPRFSAIILLLAALCSAAPAWALSDALAQASEQTKTLIDAGQYADAEASAKRAIDMAEREAGAAGAPYADNLNDLGLVYYLQGRYAAAEPVFQRALAIREKALGPDHPDVAQSLNGLAILYKEVGRYAEAEPLFARSLAIREKALGPDHLDVAQSLNSLAALYRAEGRYAAAEPLYKRALAIREKALGPDAPDVASSLGNLAGLYNAQGRYAEAEPLYTRSLAIAEKALGPDHPYVAGTLNNLGGLYQTQGRYAEAEPLYKRAVAIDEKALGPDHPYVGGMLGNLAGLYKAQGRYAEAEPLYKRSLAIIEKALGPDHPNVASSLNNLGALYKMQGRYDEAQPLYERSLAIREKALGPDHPDVAQSLGNLAELYDTQGRTAEAEPLYKRSLAIKEKALGPDHPDVAWDLGYLAVLSQGQGRYAEAESLYKRALAIREKAFGPDHPNVAQSLNSLAVLYEQQARYAEAEPLYQRALAIDEKALGPDHPHVAQSLGNLADLYRAMGQSAPAIALSQRAVATLTRHLSRGTGERSSSGTSERRQFREYFVQNIAIESAALLATGDEPVMVGETFSVAQLAQISSAGEAVAGTAARVAAGDSILAALVRDQQDVTQQWKRLDAAVIKAASEPPDQRDTAVEEKLRRELADAERRLDGFDARITREFPAFAELSNPKPLPLNAAQALLAADEALLVYLFAPQKGWLWVVRASAAKLFPLEIGADDLMFRVAELRGFLDPQRNPTAKPFPTGKSYDLYIKLMAPAAELLNGARELLVVPDGALQSLPLGVLIDKAPEKEPKSDADYRALSWLGLTKAITVLPAVSSLKALRSVAVTAKASRPFLGVGDPDLNGMMVATRGAPHPTTLFRGAIADADEVRQLPPLPETAEELREIAAATGAGASDLFLRERAREPLLRSAPLDQYRLIEFATHGLVSGDLRGLAEPALVLTPPPGEGTAEDDGLLTASKIATLKLAADWVVLSACNTAAGDGTPDGGGLSGLAKAFFYAGAHSLLVSHWPVASKPTVALTTGAFKALADHPEIGRAEALRRSMAAMMADDKPALWAHPMFWAPFVVVGEGGAEAKAAPVR